jgi:hypothetical protein
MCQSQERVFLNWEAIDKKEGHILPGKVEEPSVIGFEMPPLMVTPMPGELGALPTPKSFC